MSVTSTLILSPPPEGGKVAVNGSHKPPVENKKAAIQRLSQGVTLSGTPSFTSLELKRHWMLEHLAGAFRVFARKGFVEGLTGHISLRDPEFRDRFWVNPYGVHFGLIKVSDLIMLNEHGVPVGGATHLPAGSAGFQIHSHLHRRYPHINAAAHSHSTYGVAYSSFGRRLDMVNLDVAAFYGNHHGVYNEFNGITLDEEESNKLANALGSKGKGLILRNHGLLTVGQTVDEAAYLFCLMEKSCEIQLRIDAAAIGSGTKPILVSDEAAIHTTQTMSDPETLYCAFQPDFELEKSLAGGSFH